MKLVRRRRRCRPWNVHEIEELGHIRLRGVTQGEARQIKPRLDKFQHRRVIHNRVRNVVRFGERRNDDKRHAETGDKKSADRSGIVGADVGTRDVGGILNAVGRNSRLRRHVIVESAGLVETQDENRILPRRACHQCIHEAFHISRAGLHAVEIGPIHRRRVFVEAYVSRRLDERNLWQSAVLHVGQQLCG